MMLPSKKVIPVIAICAVGVGIISLTAFYKPSVHATAQNQANLGVVSQSTASTIDQKLYQQVENELTALATSSTVVTPTNEIPGSSQNGSQNQASTTATAVLSQEFLSEYLAMKQSGQQITSDEESSMIQDAISSGQLSDYIPQAIVYTQDNLHITNDTSANALHIYGNALGAIFTKDAVPQGLNELNIFENAVNSQNPQDLANLAIIVTSYGNFVHDIKALPLPSEAVGVDLALLNDFSQAQNSVEEMQKLFSDSVVAIVGIQDYQTISENTYNDLAAFGPFFQKYNVSFGSSEPGSRLILQQ